MDTHSVATAISNRWQNEAGLDPSITMILSGDTRERYAEMAADAALTVLPRFSECHPLVDAYHAVFNHKDAAERGGHIAVTCLEALRAIEELMIQADIPFTKRFDRERT